MTATSATRSDPRMFIRRLRRIPAVIAICMVVLGVIVIAGIFGRALAPGDPTAQDLANVLAHPSGKHWLGTDGLGRDVFSGLIVGVRSALIGPLLISIGSMLIGNLVGVLAGYRGGAVDSAIMRVVDLMLAMPALLLIIVVYGAVGGGYWMGVILLTVLSVPGNLRLVRAATLEQTPRPYVESAKTLGISNFRIMTLHIWPNISGLVVANTCLDFAGALVALSSLSFLGLGVAPGASDWGQMLSDGEPALFQNPIAALAPGLAIVLVAASVNLIGNWAYDRISSRGATR